ncbi:MAG: hypothetical protein MK135_01390 [Polyangiaceae bacterium]|nr:hypothetical protein [Polyangiaceae bacterium]
MPLPPLSFTPKFPLSARGRRISSISRTLLLLYLAGQWGCVSFDLGGGPPEQSPPPQEEASNSANQASQENTPADFENAVGTCNGWKLAYCDAVVTCSAFSARQECEDQIGYLICKDDAPYARCEAEIRAAVEADDCDALPTDCNPQDLADREAPIAACQEIADAHCEWALTCGFELNYDSCRAELQATSPCENYTAVNPGLEECLQSYLTRSCDGDVPEACLGLLQN